jgi:hypothetical protein
MAGTLTAVQGLVSPVADEAQFCGRYCASHSSAARSSLNTRVG